MYEREQDMMKNESNNTAASASNQPESTVNNQNPYSTSAATGSTTPNGYGYTTNSSTNPTTGYTGNTSSDTQSQQQGYTSIIIPIRTLRCRHPAAANRRRKRITSG